MRLIKVLSVVGLVFMMASCAGAPPKQTVAACPDWVMKGGGAFGGERGKVFYGVGTANNIKNFMLLKETADNRAINDLAKSLNVYVSSLMKDYMASTSAGDQASEEQHVERVQKTVVKQTLNGVMIVDRCHDKENGLFHSLARLDLDQFKDNVEKQAELSEKMKEYVKKNADKLHEQLEQEEQKH